MKIADCIQPEPVILFGSFPWDLIGRTPERLAERLELGDWFLRDVKQHGKILRCLIDPRMNSTHRQQRRG